MSTFISYNTSDTTTGNTALAANGTVTVGPFQTNADTKIVGSVASDQAGTLFVEQAMDNGTFWDVSQSFTVVAGTPMTIDIDVIAPTARLRYINGTTNQTYLRIFLRAFGNRGS